MAQPLLECQFTHASLPHTGRMGVPERVGGDPRVTHMQPLAVALKQFDQGMVTQRFPSFFAMAANQKDIGAAALCWSLLHHVGSEGLECLRFMQINHARSEERRVGKECRSRWS